MNIYHEQFKDSFERVFNLNVKDEALVNIYLKYQEKYRYYHNDHHIKKVCDNIELFSNAWNGITENDLEKDILILIALFHDVIYYPVHSNPQTNESASADYFKKFIYDKNNFIWGATQELFDGYIAPYEHFIQDIYNAILDTEYKKPWDDFTHYGKLFFEADCKDLLQLPYHNSTILDVIENEEKLRREFQKVPYAKYKKGKEAFFALFSEIYKDEVNTEVIELMKVYINNLKPKIGFFAGSFDPFHIGHLDILKRAEKNFEKVVIAVANNSSKKDQKDVYERKEELMKILPHHEVVAIEGLTHVFMGEYEKENNVELTLIRSLRNNLDLKNESRYEWILQKYSPNTKIVYYLSNPELVHLSSSVIRDLEVNGLDVSDYIPTKEDVYES